MPDIVHELVAQILSIADRAERRAFLVEHRDHLILDVVEQLKARADEQLLRDPSESPRIAEIAQEIALLVADDLARAVALWARGNALFYLGEYRECLGVYRNAQPVYAGHGKSLEAARLQANQVFPLLQLGEYADALRVAQDARAVFEPLGPTRYLAALEMNVGAVYRQTNDYEQALAALARGREIYAALGDLVRAAKIDVNRSNVLENTDRFDEAERLLESAREVFLANGMTQEIARTDLNLGVLAFRLGHYQLALKRLEQAHDGFAALKNKVEVAEVDLYRSYVYLALNLLPETVELASSVQRAFARQGMKRQIALASINEGAARRQLGQELAAVRCLNRARRIFQKREAIVEVALLDMERAALLRAANPRNAYRIARKSADIFASRGMVVRTAQANLLMAECALDLGRAAEAESLANGAIQVADEAKLATLAFRAHHMLGRAAEQRGEIPVAYAAYRAAVEAVEALRMALRVDEFRAGFLADKLIVYEDMVRLALALDRPAEAFDWMERANAATLVGLAPDDLREAPNEADQRIVQDLQALRRTWHWTHNKIEDIGDALSDTDRDRSANAEQTLRDQMSLLEGQMAELGRRWQVRQHPLDVLAAGLLYSLDEVRQCLDQNAALVQYFIVSGKLVALVARKETCRVTSLSSLSTLDRLLDSWRFSLESLKLYPPEVIRANLDNLCADAQAHLTRLYKVLIAPIETHLEGCRQVFVVPHIALPDVPFAALHDGYRHLVERWEIIHLPMASLVRQPPQTLSGIGNPLIMGYSDGGRLRHAVAEAQQVAEVLSEKYAPVLRVEAQVTEAEFRAHARQCNLLHLATHAAFRPDNPFFSWVRLADARLTVADLYGMALPGRPLVTLSACETARSGQRGGGLIGLVRSVLAAGASALVVSLWKVDDASTARFMHAFYQALGSGQSISTALRLAQLETLAEHRHPLYWAPFILVQGDGVQVGKQLDSTLSM